VTTIRRLVLLVIGALSLGVHLDAQQIAPDTPAPVVRRAAQAIWPENLFDASGQPEPGFVRLPFRPGFSDLRIERHPISSGRFAGVVLFAASAYPNGCWHCRNVRRAVAQRDSTFVTLLEADEVEQILPWATPAFAMTDSVEVRQAVVELIDATCILGCGVRRVRDLKEVPRHELYTAVAPGAERWTMPRTYSHVSTASLTLEFPLLAPEGLFKIGVYLDPAGRYNVLVTPVARVMLGG
jgi:hypothetical protein